ncbi:hypothetical protein [Bacillus norwichensis]|uniref:Uncharacterized protein n=1 Tax=Bacillus norwichensis TaxID=2762217 RepID=A0ABR8VKT5_9BACI|nr:hypothetical protein [Bacillus norwichensis]MBD8005383.1 hypothetical protein [Bacillus norwichensis]
MAAIKKELLEANEWVNDEDDVVNDIRKVDHWLLFGIGILPLLVFSIWYYIVY